MPATGGVADATFPLQQYGAQPTPFSAGGPTDTVLALSGTSAEGVAGFPYAGVFSSAAMNAFGLASGALAFTQTSGGQERFAKTAPGAVAGLPAGGALPLTIGTWVSCAPGGAPGTLIELGYSGAPLAGANGTQRVALQAVSSVGGGAAASLTCGKPCVSTLAAVGNSGPVSVALSPSGTLHVTTPCQVWTIDSVSGAMSHLAGNNACGASGASVDGASVGAFFDATSGIAFNASGDAIVSQRGALRRVTPAGVVTTVAGLSLTPFVGFADGVGAAALFTQVRAIATARGGTSGVFYVVDADFIRAVRFPNGTSGFANVTLLTGSGLVTSSGVAPGYANGPISSATFRAPTGLAVDAAGNIYVADTVRALPYAACSRPTRGATHFITRAIYKLTSSLRSPPPPTLRRRVTMLFASSTWLHALCRPWQAPWARAVRPAPQAQTTVQERLQPSTRRARWPSTRTSQPSM